MTAIVKQENALTVQDQKASLKIADDCAKLIREKGLSVKIQGRDFVKAEGWQFAGTQLGLLPMVEKPIRLDRGDDEIAYECECKLINLNNDAQVGYGYALCSNKEPTKKMFAEYAIASMAQTRAEGKAYRNLIAWIMQASGFEPTPAEEMDEVTVTATDKPAPKPHMSMPTVDKPDPIYDAPAKVPTIDITKDPVTVGKHKGKIWKDLPSHYLQALREEKYWTTLSPALQKAVLETIEYQSKHRKEEKVVSEPESETAIVFDDKGDVKEVPVIEVKPEEVKIDSTKSAITPQDRQLASLIKEWEMPALKDDTEKITQDQIDFLQLLMSSKLFNDQERSLLEVSLKQWGHNTTALQTRIYIVQFKQRFQKKYNVSADTI